MVTVNISKKDLYLIIAVFVFFIGAGFVIATGGTPSNNGHTFGEIAMPVCADGQVLKYSTATNQWGCADLPTYSVPSGTLCGDTSYNDIQGWHYGKKCLGFNTYDSCPSGYTQDIVPFNQGVDKFYTCIKN